MFNKVVKELKVLGAVDYIKVKSGLKDTRELKVSQQYKLGYNQREGVKEKEAVDYTVTDPYNLRSLVFYEDQIGTTVVRARVVRREEHGKIWAAGAKANYTNVITEYITLLVISQTECKVISVKEVKEYREGILNTNDSTGRGPNIMRNWGK
jgi:hypothetical protein